MEVDRPLKCLLQIDLAEGTNSDSTQVYFTKANDIGNISQDHQATYGNCLSRPLNDDFPISVELKTQDANVQSLLQKKSSLNKYEKKTFENNFRKLLDMLSIAIDGHVIKSLLHFWNPYYMCFTFGIIELTLIIEKYSDFFMAKLSISNMSIHIRFEQ